ncbi:hypothetical protein, variant [Aphanomyces astaci]|uniref:Uncharacterized protein n=1 Tax=Aphanomyces astaci TaxID=112090 RepID=W4FVQ2_APHAT|nr:hypothetical protein, variant [Aphanomyces astaci]ETV71590.1 hypothetical protein, variant [Aphanomyces astaci]|eukprot:XP_009838778.1 hypothetical protein, variant [Aphanomyces astaci]
MQRRDTLGKKDSHDGSPTIRRVSTVVRTVSAVNRFNVLLKKRIKRRAGWTRKQATLDDVTRHCQTHMERLGSLPPMSAEIKLDSIEKAVKANLTFKGEWTTFYWSKFFFRSPIVVHMISDLFWWASLEFFNQSDGNEPLPADCYAHVAQAYVEHQVAMRYGKLLTKVLYTTLPTGAADEFLDYFPYCVSRTVYKAMQKAYPDFIVQMRHSCSRRMIDAISEWTTGVKTKCASWSAWRADIQNRKLRHGPKPNLIVRDVLDEFTMQEEEIPSDDSNDADFLSEDEASNGMAAYDMNDDADSSEEMVHQRLQLPPASAPGRSKVSLKFSPSVDKIMHMYNYTGCQGRKLGYTMTVSDGSCSTVHQHIQQHESYLQHSAELRSSRSFGTLSSIASVTLDKELPSKGDHPGRSRLGPCEFEIKNPVAEARERRLGEAKTRQHEVQIDP